MKKELDFRTKTRLGYIGKRLGQKLEVHELEQYKKPQNRFTIYNTIDEISGPHNIIGFDTMEELDRFVFGVQILLWDTEEIKNVQ